MLPLSRDDAGVKSIFKRSATASRALHIARPVAPLPSPSLHRQGGGRCSLFSHSQQQRSLHPHTASAFRAPSAPATATAASVANGGAAAAAVLARRRCGAMRVRVALPTGGVHEVELGADAAVGDLAARVAALEAVDLSTHRVRLVAAGKLLADAGARVADAVRDGGFVHCAVSEKHADRPARRRRRRSVLRVGTDEAGDVVLFLGRARRVDAAGEYAEADGGGGDSGDGGGGGGGGGGGVGGREDDGEDGVREGDGDGDGGGDGDGDGDGDDGSEDGEVRLVLPSLTARGFDRLGLPAAEVGALRRQFRAARGLEPDDEEDTVDAEEAWLSTAIEEELEGGSGSGGEGGGGDGASARRRRRRDRRVVVAAGVEGSNTDFLLGCVCGYLLGVLTIALLLDKNISRKWRVGIIAGVATNAAFGVLRNSLYFQSGSPFPGR